MPLMSLPSELLLQIFTHLPPKAFLSIRHTHPFLRKLLLTHAAPLCNHLITTHYAVAAAVLRPEMRGGWLVPTHEHVRKSEEEIRREAREERRCGKYGVVNVWCGDVKRGVGDGDSAGRAMVRLSEPGPQFLQFLERHDMEMRIFDHLELEGHWTLYCVKAYLRALVARRGEQRALLWFYGLDVKGNGDEEEGEVDGKGEGDVNVRREPRWWEDPGWQDFEWPKKTAC